MSQLISDQKINISSTPPTEPLLKEEEEKAPLPKTTTVEQNIEPDLKVEDLGKTSDIQPEPKIKSEMEKIEENSKLISRDNRDQTLFERSEKTRQSNIKNSISSLKKINPVQPETDLFNQVISTGDMAEDLEIIKSINNAYGLYTPYDREGNLLPGAIVDGNQNIENSRFVLFSPNNQNRVQSIIRAGSVILAQRVPDNVVKEDVVQQPVTIGGETKLVNVVRHTLPQFRQNLEYTGYRIGKDNKIVYEDPNVLGRLFDLVYTSDEDKEKARRRYANTLVNNGVDNPFLLNRILDLHDKGVIKSIELNETLKDLGKFFINTGLLIANYGIVRAGVTIDAAKGIADLVQVPGAVERMLQDPEAAAFVGYGAQTILEAKILKNPDEQDKVVVGQDGIKRIKFEFIPYAEDILAENLGITKKQAGNIVDFNDDATEAFKELLPEALTFALGEGLYAIGKGTQLFANSFKPFVLSKFPEAKTYEEAVEIANKKGVFMSAVLNEWAESNLGPIARRRVFKNMVVERKKNLVKIGQSLSGTGIGAGTTKQAIDALNNYEIFHDQATDLFAKASGAATFSERAKLRAKAYATQVKAVKALYADQYIPKVVVELAGDEIWAAGGASLVGHTLATNFNEDSRPVGEFFGAILGITLIRSGTKAAVKGAFNIIPGAPSLLKNMLNEYRLYKGEGFGKFLSLRYKDIYEELWSAMPPEQQNLIEAKINSFGELEEFLTTVTLPDGKPAFEEGEIPTLLADITGLVVLKEITDHFNTRILASDVVQRIGIAASAQDVIAQRAKLSKKIGTVLDRIANVEGVKADSTNATLLKGFQELQRNAEITNAEDFSEFDELVKRLEDNLTVVLTSGTVLRDSDGVEITSLNARELLTAKDKEILNKYTNAEGIIKDIDGYLSEVENLATTTRDAFQQKSKAMANVGEAKTINSLSIDLVNNFSFLKENDRQKRDALYTAFRNEAPDARFDGTNIYNLITKDEGVYAKLSEDISEITLEGDLELSSADIASMTLAGGSVPKKLTVKAFFNSAAMDEFRNNPVIVQAAGITKDMTDKQILDKLIKVRDDLLNNYDIDNLSEDAMTGKTPTDIFDFFKEVGERTDIEGLGEIGFTKEFSDSLNIPLSPIAFQNLTKFLGRSADPKTSLGAALIKTRKGLLEDIQDPEKGFQLNFYGVREPALNVTKRLEEANTFNVEFQARYNNPDVSTYELEKASSQTKVKSAEKLDALVDSAITRSKDTTNPQGIASQTIGADLARIFGAPFVDGPDGKKGFYLIEGEASAEQARNTLKALADSKLWLSGPGQEILRLGKKSGGLGYKFSEGQLLQIKTLYGGTRKYTTAVKDDEVLSYVEMLSRIQVYPRKADGTVDFENPQQLISQEELFEVIDITNFYEMAPRATGAGARKIRREGGITDYNVGAIRAADDLKKAISKLKIRRNAEENIVKGTYNSIKQVVQSLESATLKPGQLVSNLAQTEIGFTRLKEARDQFVKGFEGKEAERAKEIFNEEVFSVLAYEITQQVRSPDGGIDPVKLANILNDTKLMRVMEDLNPESTDIMRQISELATTTLDRKKEGSPRVLGFSTPFNMDTEINKIWAVTTGRGSLRWWMLQLATRQGRKANEQLFRAMLEDPRLGRDLIDVVRSGKKPNDAKVTSIYDTLLTYIALDIYRHNDDENNGGFFIPIASSAGSVAKTAGSFTVDSLFGETTKRGRLDPVSRFNSTKQLNDYIQDLQGEQ